MEMLITYRSLAAMVIAVGDWTERTGLTVMPSMRNDRYCGYAGFVSRTDVHVWWVEDPEVTPVCGWWDRMMEAGERQGTCRTDLITALVQQARDFAREHVDGCSTCLVDVVMEA